MRTVSKLAASRIRKSIAGNVLQSVSAFVSMFMVSTLVIYMILLNNFTRVGINSINTDSSAVNLGTGEIGVEGFVSELFTTFFAVAVMLAIMALLSIWVNCRMRSDDDTRFYSVLASLGATAHQRCAVRSIELIALYAVPVFLASVLAAPAAYFMAISMTQLFDGEFEFTVSAGGVSLFLAILGIAFVLIASGAPAFRKRGSVIESVRRHNYEEADTNHGYRRSHTFRSMSVERRISRKNADYHKKSYRRISIMIAECAMYPLIALLFFYTLSDARIVVDSNPFDSVDTSESAIGLITGMTALCGVCFLLMLICAIAQTVVLVRLHARMRRDTLRIYRSVGMSDRSIALVIRYEHSGIAIRAIAFVILAAVAVTLTLIVT